jgi:chemotaxis protein MotB
MIRVPASIPAFVSRAVAVVAVAHLAGGCVMNSTYATALKKWEGKHRESQAQIEALTTERNALQARLDEIDTQLTQTTLTLSDREATLVANTEKLSEKTEQLQATESEKAQLSTQLSSLAEQEKKLRAEKDALDEEKSKLAKEVQELRRLRAASEARTKEYQNLLGKLRKMIDAGSLEVKFRNGVMLVQMPSDVLFPAGKAELKPEAVEAIKELAGTLKQFKGRKFQVVGHSDSQPISNEEFPSNWELSSKRAVEVVKVLVDAGVPPEMVNAAGSASYDPLAANNSTRNKAKNRRVELIFVPKIDELPDLDGVGK